MRIRLLLLLLVASIYARRRTTTPAVKEEEYDDYEEEDDEYSRFYLNLGDVNTDQHHAGSHFQQASITSVFTDKKSFLCPHVKPALHTGTSLADLSPEDIDVVAALGDSLASGRGLWAPSEVDFRGAAFPIGGDANIDGLVTIPNLLLEFNEDLEGVSHGMGSRDRLPDHQFNVANSGARTRDMPEQADELVRRVKLHAHELEDKWLMATMAIGTEEMCDTCSEPDVRSLRIAMAKLRTGIPKIFVILLGPAHVASSYSQNVNMMKKRCSCLEALSKNQYSSLLRKWANIFYDVQMEFNSLNYTTFGVLAIPQLPIHSRDPNSLFTDGEPQLNRRGHTYAAKWLWNRLLAGPSYNTSAAVFSKDAYYCPSVGCPYFRTPQNFEHCSILTQDDFEAQQSTTRRPRTTTVKTTRRETIRRNLAAVIVIVVFLALLAVCLLGGAFYCHGLRATKGRFEELSGV
ncbi:hypothetical protein PRIPAC_89562 [Pristionchus pacificus]|uniref:Lipase n=1 Tax=Pristionchus pacificus TaxID=54126 RepID=A0A2A6CY08_PRIPA|nr:hypothetical protein PRIPAC_89562 [Pristionchus pacificus]|eukprot:PDM82911.1 lipase [Pristionchus pacificus]